MHVVIFVQPRVYTAAHFRPEPDYTPLRRLHTGITYTPASPELSLVGLKQ
jgi:hypothetical protein